jgi:hypothetical protein
MLEYLYTHTCIVDFICIIKKLIVELEIHNMRKHRATMINELSFPSPQPSPAKVFDVLFNNFRGRGSSNHNALTKHQSFFYIFILENCKKLACYFFKISGFHGVPAFKLLYKRASFFLHLFIKDYNGRIQTRHASSQCAPPAGYLFLASILSVLSKLFLSIHEKITLLAQRDLIIVSINFLYLNKEKT